MGIAQRLAAALGCALEHMESAHPDAQSAREALAAYDATVSNIVAAPCGCGIFSGCAACLEG